MRALKIEWVDVFIFFGRIFGELHGAVRATAKPFWMLSHVGMVGRGLESDIQRNLNPLFSCLRLELFEIGQGSEPRIDGFVSAFRGTDGPGASHIVLLNLDAVVLTLAAGSADRVNGGKVENIK